LDLVKILRNQNIEKKGAGKMNKPAKPEDAEKLQSIANRFYNVFDPWEACDTTPEETAEEISKNPLDAIAYLLDIIENY